MTNSPKIKSMSELEAEYIEHTAQLEEVCFDWGKWLPALGDKLRPMVPGELAFVFGDTGSGKSACLQSISLACAPLRCLFCELELPGTLMYERYVAMHTGISCKEIEQKYREAYGVAEVRSFLPPAHLAVCEDSRIDEYQLEEMINKTHVEKFGCKPVMVIVDYIGLMNTKGAKRYERVSRAAEELKRTAKNTNTMIVCASQIHRAGDEEAQTVGIHSAKDSSSIEHSAGIIFGITRCAEPEGMMKVKVLKSTKDGGGTSVDVYFDGDCMRMTQWSSKYGTSDFDPEDSLNDFLDSDVAQF